MKKKIADMFNFEKSNTKPDKRLMTLSPKSPDLINLRERGSIWRVGNKSIDLADMWTDADTIFVSKQMRRKRQGVVDQHWVMQWKNYTCSLYYWKENQKKNMYIF